MDTTIVDPSESLRLLQHAPALIWRSDTKAKCYWFNETWLTFTGRSLQQEAGDGWSEGVHPDDFDMCLSTFLSCFEARRPFAMEYRFRRHDGIYRWILDHGIPSHDACDVFDGYIGYCFDISDRKTLEQSTAERAIELERLNAELRLARQELEHLALSDSLTGLSNRHDILRRFDFELAKKTRSRTPLSMLLIDLDFFKKVNDGYGHAAGDEALKAIARELRGFSRASDTPGRLGGEEFVLILPNTDAADAFEVATRIRLKIAGTRFDIMGVHIPLSVSIGCATVPANDSLGFSEMLQSADKALYRAKEAGRNGVVVAEFQEQLSGAG